MNNQVIILFPIPPLRRQKADICLIPLTPLKRQTAK